jgi:integration host factor subunit beta
MTKNDLKKKMLLILPYLSINDANKIINSIIDTMISTLKSNSRIEIRGFGSFKVKKRKKYNGRNPLTGEFINIAEKLVIYFSTGKKLLNRINKKF